jgi:hypothetical protein
VWGGTLCGGGTLIVCGRYINCGQAEGTGDTPLLGRGRASRVPPFHLQEAARPWDLLPLTFR